MGQKVARLYEQFQPEHYDLHLVPDRDNMRFSGSITIRGKKVGRPSERITFHQKDLKITDARIIKHEKNDPRKIEVERINNQDSLNEVRIHAKEKIYPGDYSVILEFEGAITRHMNGIYPCNFKLGGQEKSLIATQFESHHAREAFPCIDEPEAKAVFELTLTTPAGETVLSNTPVISQEPVKDGELTLTKFEQTPRMSTYLLAFAYGELGFAEGKTKNGVVVRSYATPDNVPLLDFSVDVAVRVLEFFEDYFGVPYPLQKLDMIALPDFSSGAMENWGLVTYRETAMLVDPKHTSIESKQMVALVIAHELSHQWFGNLVTMKWWDDLWLNESFANMMEYRVIDALYPEWQVWEQFVSHEGVSAKRRDSLVDVQPIHMEVRHPDEISTLFDPSIVYAKGGTVLYMLLNYLGEDVFRSGLQAYFKKHAYGNTEANDLWEALQAASHQDVGAFMEKWLTQPGYPLVDVDWIPGTKSISLQQQRFLSDPSATSNNSEPWQVPLATTIPVADPLFASLKATTSLTDSSDEPLIFNHDGKSYYLPHYQQAAHLQQIINGITQHNVSAIDRLLLLDNYILLQRAGISSTAELLDLLSAYQAETSENVWGSMALSISEARKLIENHPASEEKLDQFVATLVISLAESLGWDDKPDDSAQTLRLRGLAISLAAGAKVQSIIDEGLKRFAEFKKPSDLSPSTRTTVYYCGARYGSTEDFEKLLSLYETIQNADEKDEIAAGLTSVKEPQRYEKLLSLLDTDFIRRQDLMHWYAWLLRNRYSRASAWQWLTTHWDWVQQEFSSDKSFGYFARFCGGVFSTDGELEQFKNFFEPKKSIVALARDVTLAEQEIRSRVAWRERNEVPVKEWLAKH